ncbi:MAG: ATP-binding cassette domain-containing protein [Chitinophagales bacterium]|nr:ATP-binding cassette domain-containing protein [Chitinophagales bacterium]MDW8418505.1 ATP-binding cassette domain-containing protein [Chitinophagales bacterium]
MHHLSLRHISKKYHNHLAADNISFEVPQGQIFGLLGPNGAGKTTLIRMITRILFPDSGEILLSGEPLCDNHTRRIGYMPEERGLYKKMRVYDHLIYLARLKGLSRRDAAVQTEHWLQKFDITTWQHKRIEELSKGMSQKVQFIATVLHKPDLLILDEPFSGLDPINSQLIEAEIRALSKQGCTIIFSTHRLEQVEEICSDIVLINRGKVILQGNVKTLKQQFKENIFEIYFTGTLVPQATEGLHIVTHDPGRIVVKWEANTGSNQLLRRFLDADVQVYQFRELLPTIQELFIKQVKQHEV